jgi:hypothetical protein
LAAYDERNAWADAHLAAEKAVATWWRGALTDRDAERISETEWREFREGTLWEVDPNGIPGDALYPVNGRGHVSSLTGGEYVSYECDTNYGDAQSGGCVPADRDYDCGELRSWGIANIPVIGEDWMLLDDDGDGWGCNVVASAWEPPTPSSTLDEETSPVTVTVNVYDYTTVGTPWTPLVIATIAEFNAVSPAAAPQLAYVAAPGDADCLDITADVEDITGIIVCDTSRPEEFPDDPNAPVDGWSGATGSIDDDTTVIILNNIIPGDVYRPDSWGDNTVCHEMMHAYTGVADSYGSDLSGSCVWGYLLSPGPTDLRLMQELYPVTMSVESVADEEPSLWDRIRATGREKREQMCDALADADIGFPDVNLPEIDPGPVVGHLIELAEARDLVREVVPDVDIDIPGVDIPLPHPDLDMPDMNLPTCRTTD